MATRKMQIPGTIQRSFKPPGREVMAVAFFGLIRFFDFLLIHFPGRMGATPVKTQIRGCVFV
jgi:hypothetical protein